MSQRRTAFNASPSSAFRAGDVTDRARQQFAPAEEFSSALSEALPDSSQWVRNPKNTIPAVNRALDLVQLLAEDGDETHTKALALRLGIPHTTCYRILCSLIRRGWVRHLAGGGHELAPGLRPAFPPFRWAEQAAEVMRPRLFALAGRCHSDAMLSLRQGDYAIAIAHGAATPPKSAATWEGTALHLTTSSAGAVFLSRCRDEAIGDILHRSPPVCWERQRPHDVWRRIKSCRTRGWCSDRGAIRPDVSTLSTALCDLRQEVFAAMTLISPSPELPSKREDQSVETLLQAARQSERELRRLGPPPATEKPAVFWGVNSPRSETPVKPEFHI